MNLREAENKNILYDNDITEALLLEVVHLNKSTSTYVIDELLQQLYSIYNHCIVILHNNYNNLISSNNQKFELLNENVCYEF